MRKSQILNCKINNSLFSILIISVIIFTSPVIFSAQNSYSNKANYSLASRFTPAKLKKLIFSLSIDPHWLKHSDCFWYTYETSEGKMFFIIDPEKKTKKPLFENVRMAAMLTEITKDPYDAKHLPIKEIEFVKKDKAIRFEVESSQEEEEEGEEKKEKPKKKIFTFEYDLLTGKLALLKDYEKPPKKPDWANISPDGETIVFARHHNLYWMDKENYEKYLKDKKASDIQEHQLTEDGEEDYSYAQEERGETNVEKEKNKDKRKPVRIIWSRDSKKFAMVRTDNREVKDLWVIHSLTEPRPSLETYKYHMPGEEEAPQYDVLIFDLQDNKKIQVQDDRFKDQSVSIITARTSAKNLYDDYQPDLWLAETSDKLYFIRTSRDFRRVDICLADASTGEVRVLIEERFNTYIETFYRKRGFELINNGQELILWSERDGFAHFYLYDGEGNLKNQITSGPFHCQDIAGIDEKNRVLYFIANGREKNENPYYTHLYRVNFDGIGLKLLNPGNFNHTIFINDSNRFFIDSCSRVNTAPESSLYDTRGNFIMNLEKADISLLLEAGFKFPETFKVKADDGITDLYGVMYKPFDFDKNRKYPIIAHVYPGPQTEAVPQSFTEMLSRRSDNIGLAQFGFIVIVAGHRGGHPARSKWYHNYGYGNLRDYALADKKATIEKLAARHSFIDIEKVGIYGHSGGGFMSTAAMLVYPDFFKVAISSSGNHENNIYNRAWSEKHHGVEEVVDEDGNVKFEYHIDKNSEIANNLKGHLLLVTGAIDNNVHPANTLRVVDALIKANKRFDFFIFPGLRHGLNDIGDYWFWLRADYFCKHLLGDYSDSIDVIELNREKEKTGGKE